MVKRNGFRALVALEAGLTETAQFGYTPAEFVASATTQKGGTLKVREPSAHAGRCADAIRTPARCCLVLGMHRSGTSCLARILHAAGLHLGQDLLVDHQDDNLAGHWESLRAVEINDRLLAHSGGSWDRPPARVVADAALDCEMAQFVESLAGRAAYGWKDPRTTLTLPAWLPHLQAFNNAPPAKPLFVGCFRHPYQVAQSLCVRENRDFAQNLELWREYNERLLAYHEQRFPFVWMPYDADRAAYSRRIERLCDELGVNYSERLLDLRNDFLRHHRAEPVIAEPAVRKVYARLCQLARSQADETGDTIECPGAPLVPEPRPEFGELQRRLDALAEAFTCSNAARQRDVILREQMGGQLAAAITRLAGEIAENRLAHERQLGELRDEHCRSLEASVAELTKRLEQVQVPIETLRLPRLANWLRRIKQRILRLRGQVPGRRAA